MINMCIMTIRVLYFFYIYKGFQKSLYQCTRAHFLCDTAAVISNREWPLLQVSEREKNLLTGFYSREEPCEKKDTTMYCMIFQKSLSPDLGAVKNSLNRTLRWIIEKNIHRINLWIFFCERILWAIWQVIGCRYRSRTCCL